VDKEESLETNLVVAALKGRRTLVLSGKITRDSMRALREELLSLQIISNERITSLSIAAAGKLPPRSRSVIG
jgi:hypothetical protein